MYSVSEKYIEQMMKKATRRRLSGTIGNVPFSGSDVIRDSFNVSGRATDQSDTKLGGVYLGEIELTFTPSFLSKIARDEFNNKVLSVSIGLWVNDDELEAGGEWVDVPMGVYTLQSPKISKQGITVTGYDNMKKLDKKFNLNQTTGTPYAYLTYMATQCGVTLGQTQQEIEALPNGTESLGLYPESDIETYRDYLYWLAQACGCFACADRSGNIVLRHLGNATDIELDEMHRDIDVVFSGYTTKWTGITFVDIATQMTNYYGLEVDDGLTMNLGANPFLQVGSSVAVTRRRVAVLNAVAAIQYTPFYCNSTRDPIFDLGDEVAFTGGISGDCTGCIMAYSYSLTNYNYEGFGDDPDLANGRSKTDKNIAGLMQSTIENEVTYYNYANVESITFGSEHETTIASVSFTAAQQTTVKILHEFIFDMLADLAASCSYEVRYYLDEQLLAYKPYEQIGGIQGLSEGNTTEFSITRDFFYIIKDIEPSVRHTWRVAIITHGVESTTIEQDHAHVTIEGQRMYGEDYFDGHITVREDITVVPLGYLGFVSTTDNVSITMYGATVAACFDNIELQAAGGIAAMPMFEGTGALSPHIFFQLEEGYILTEAGDNLTTENGDRLIL